MAEQMPLIRHLVMVQQQYIMYNKAAADRSPPTPAPPNPDQHSFSSHLHSSIQAVAALLSPAAPRSRNELPASVTILKVSYYPSPLLWRHTSLNKRHPPHTPPPSSRHPSCLLPFLLLHSCLISSLQWTRLFCFCNSQFDFFRPLKSWSISLASAVCYTSQELEALLMHQRSNAVAEPQREELISLTNGGRWSAHQFSSISKAPGYQEAGRWKVYNTFIMTSGLVSTSATLLGPPRLSSGLLGIGGTSVWVVWARRDEGCDFHVWLLLNFFYKKGCTSSFANGAVSTAWHLSICENIKNLHLGHNKRVFILCKNS